MIKFDGIITSISSKVDRSLRLGIVTPELSAVERAAFMEFQNLPLEISIDPQDTTSEVLEVEKGMEGETPSKRLRNVLFVYYKQQNRTEPFAVYYANMMEELINRVKEKLEPR
jgi:hypothetical protein